MFYTLLDIKDQELVRRLFSGLVWAAAVFKGSFEISKFLQDEMTSSNV